ncbi:MAG: two-component system cell cycle sensor histidine kinase/response regulator CckA [Candidatus Latescibacterota bacterium]|jgi:two-component system cell cycle sensor histidine kinase/response regulator CckA
MPQGPDPSSNLRKQAERKIAPRLGSVSELAALSAEETQRLLHELQVHQIELEMQNEELQRAQNELETSRDRYSDLYDFAPVAYFTIGEKDTIEEANLTGATLLGVERHTLIGQSLSRFVLPEHQDTFYLHRKQILETGESQRCEIEMITAMGTKFFGELKSLIVTERGTSKNRYRVAISDITQRVVAEKEIIKTHNLESLGLLAGGIAHDFNNVLTGIFANIQMLQLTLDKDAPGYHYVTDAWDATLKTRDLTAQLLTFATGGTPLKEIASIEELIKRTTQLSLSGSKTRPAYHFSENLFAADIDVSQIGQVIQNLVINANQAMPSGGILNISADNVRFATENAYGLKAGAYVKVTFTDQGVGMSEEIVKHIFDPYFTTKQAGHGLGLSIVYSIVSRHEGHIAVRSKVDTGTTFELFLPASEEKTVALVTKEKTLPTGTSKILIMDDEDIICTTIGRILRKLGYVVDTASDGHEALQAYQASVDAGSPYHIVIMDLTIPGGMGGEETIQQLHQKHPEARGIVTSGYANNPVMTDYKKYGFRGRVNKPMDLGVLTKTIEDVLAQ